MCSRACRRESETPKVLYGLPLVGCEWVNREDQIRGWVVCDRSPPCFTFPSGLPATLSATTHSLGPRWARWRARGDRKKHYQRAHMGSRSVEHRARVWESEHFPSGGTDKPAALPPSDSPACGLRYPTSPPCDEGRRRHEYLTVCIHKYHSIPLTGGLCGPNPTRPGDLR
jgi:hypothetical protein